MITFNQKYCPFEPKKYGSSLKTTSPLIAPFHSDLTTTPMPGSTKTSSYVFSGLYLKENVSNSVNLERATEDVQKYFEYKDFEAIWIYVATYYKARAFGSAEVIFTCLKYSRIQGFIWSVSQ